MGTQEAIIYAYDLTTVPSILPAFANAKDLIVVDEAGLSSSTSPHLAQHRHHNRSLPNFDPCESLSEHSWPISTSLSALHAYIQGLMLVSELLPQVGRYSQYALAGCSHSCMHDLCASAQRSSINTSEQCFVKQRSFSRWICTDTCDHHEA